MEISNETKRSVCKSAAYGAEAKLTGEMHNLTEDDVKKIWEENPDLVQEYKEQLTEMGVI